MDNLYSGAWSPNSQKRKSLRFTMEYPVRIKFQAENSTTHEIETFSKNVSLRGLLVKSAARIPLHTSVTFIMSVQREQAVRPIQLAGEGEIVRIEDDITDEMFLIAVRCKRPLIQLEGYLPV
jgi:hypothetical protein